MSVLLGLDLTRISQFTTSGVFPRPSASGQHDLAACVQAYIRSLRTDSTMSEERRLLTKAKRQREELRVRRERGELIELDSAKEEAFQVGRRVRDVLLSVPDRIAGIVSAERNQSTNYATILSEMHQACQELSQWCLKTTRSLTPPTRPTRQGNGTQHDAHPGP